MIKPKLFNDDKGSSSVLVILVMLLLITFGVLAMMSSYSNLKIARKNASWTQGYYALESEANLNYNKVVQVIDAAIDLSDALLVEPSRIKWSIYPFEDALKESLDPLMQQEDQPDVKWIREVLLNWTFYQLYNIQEGLPEIETVLLEALIGAESFEPFEVEFVTQQESTGRRLFAALGLKDDQVVINQWREIPAEFDYSNSIGFSDPEDNK